MPIRLLLTSIWLWISDPALGCLAMEQLAVSSFTTASISTSSPTPGYRSAPLSLPGGHPTDRILPSPRSANRIERLAHQRQSEDDVILAYSPAYVRQHGFSAGFRKVPVGGVAHRVQYITSRFAETGVPDVADFHESAHVYWDRLARQGKATPMHATIKRGSGGTSKFYGKFVVLEELNTMAVSEEGARRGTLARLGTRRVTEMVKVSQKESKPEAYREALRICLDTRETVRGIRSRLGRGLNIWVEPSSINSELSRVEIANGDERLLFLAPACDGGKDRALTKRIISDQLDNIDKVVNEMEGHFKKLLEKHELLMSKGTVPRAELEELLALQRKAFEASLLFLPEADREPFSRMVFFEEERR